MVAVVHLQAAPYKNCQKASETNTFNKHHALISHQSCKDLGLDMARLHRSEKLSLAEKANSIVD